MSSSIAILLCAGYGTRLGELTRTVPKPLLELADRPMLDYLVDQLLDLDGLDAVEVVTNHHYAPAFDAWASGVRPRVEATGKTLGIHDDGTFDAATRLGAVGDLAFVLERLATPPDSALVAAGDNILRFSLGSFWRAFRTRGASIVLALEEADPARLRKTGVLELGIDDRVIGLHEKPEVPPSTWACPSVYALDSDALARVRPYLDEGRPHDEIGRLIADVVARQPVWAERIRGSRLHVGDPASLSHADATLRREPVLLD
ncbi:MAG: sugar phosphate nucleotidyltransferase [Acidobacteriota bacterium]